MANGIPDLGKKVGPLPLGVWIAVLLGGLGLAYFINKRQGGGSAAPAEEGLAAEPGVGTGGQQFESTPPATTIPMTPSGYETNDQWARAGILHLLSEGKDPNESTLALSRYISEQPLTAAQQALVGLVINAIGPPPFLPINPPDNPPTTTPPVTPPADPVLTAPTGLKTWGNGPSVLTVPLEWNRVTGAAYYRVYRKGVAFNVGASTDTRTTIGGLKPGTSYTFHVRAVSAKGKLGPPSSSLTAKTKK